MVNLFKNHLCRKGTGITKTIASFKHLSAVKNTAATTSADTKLKEVQQTAITTKTDNLSAESTSKKKVVSRIAKYNDAQAIFKKARPLIDTYGREHTYLRISLTERCNLRCQYCMPAEGVPLQPKSHLLTNDEIYYLARIFVQQGVRKIRLTGGEPTVRRDIVDIIANIKAIPKLEQLGITTNGLVLTRILVPMQRAGLDALNISLDTLKTKRYEQLTRRKGWERVIAGIDLAIQLGYKPKINCVLMRNYNDDEICDFVEFTRERNIDVRFIEYMPFTGNKWQTEKLVPFRDALAIIRARWPDLLTLPNGPNDTSKAYAVPGYKGQVGFISSMTEHFCGTCNRLRLTADGNIKVCLFGDKEFSLRDAIRNNCEEQDLLDLIRVAVTRKQKQHAAILWQLFHGHHNNHSSLNAALQQQRKQQLQQIRNYSDLTHIDAEGKAVMVDVTSKKPTTRTASALATVIVGPHIAKLIAKNLLTKGDVLSIAQLAGILGAKRTSELIPLCHNITLTSVKVVANLNVEQHIVEITATVRCCGQTGVEMEALTAVSIAALTVYDMCKAISHDICITNIRLTSKTGGKRDFGKIE